MGLPLLQFGALVVLTMFETVTGPNLPATVLQWWSSWVRSGLPMWAPTNGPVAGLFLGGILANGLVEMTIARTAYELVLKSFPGPPGRTLWQDQRRYERIAWIVCLVIFLNPTAWLVDGFTLPYDLNLDVFRIGPAMIMICRGADEMFRKALPLQPVAAPSVQ